MTPPPMSRSRSLWPMVLAAFLAGVVAERWGWLPGSDETPPKLRRTFAPFWQAWHIVEAEYVDREAVERQRMTHGAISGMLASLGDVGHTTFLTREELSQLTDQLAGRLEGVGASMTLRDGRPTVLYTIPNSPARAAGLQPGDVLSQVDGKDVSGLPLDQIVRLVRGPPGTTVHLRVLRHGTSAPIDLTITRANVQVASVAWRVLPGQPIAHIAIRDFGEHTDQELKTAIQQARQQGANGFLLDLRGDPGGLKTEAVAAASEFLKEGIVFIEVDAHGRREEVPVQAGGTATEVAVVALIDQGTASSAEIVAGALQDHQRATLVGTRSFGTGTVLRPFPLRDGSAILLAVAKWLTPKGREIWHRGITPDVEVQLPAGAMALMPEVEAEPAAPSLEQSSDKQFLKALEALRKQLAKAAKR